MCILWESSRLDKKYHQILVQALDLISVKQSGKAISYVKDIQDSEPRSLILGYAYAKLKDYKKAFEYLAPLLLKPDSCLNKKGYELMISELSRSAEFVDPEFAKVLLYDDYISDSKSTSYIVKSFFFGGAKINKQTLYQQVLKRKHTLDRRLDSERKIRPLTYRIEFLKKYSSTTYLTETDNDFCGGGYFLVADRFGCVIDPGYNFLDNFLRKGHNIGDIDAIFVTHCHDDHNADMPALLSLLYRQKNKQVQLFLDEKTYNKYEDLINSSKYIYKPCQPISASFDKWSLDSGIIRLTNNISIQPIPSHHKITQDDKENSAIGLHFIILNNDKEIHLLISGDTAWKPEEMKNIYSSFSELHPILVVHVSTACEEEGLGILGLHEKGYHGNHLGIRGTVELIGSCSPSKVILSEIGEELSDTIQEFASLIGKSLAIPCFVGMMGDAEGERISLLP